MNLVKSAILNGVLIAIVAHGLIGISLIWDKVLLKKPATKNLASYVFWLGAISVFGLLLIPFGFRFPGWRIAGIAFVAGLLDLIASYFYYSALKTGEASEELAAIGGFGPVTTALIAAPLLHATVEGELAGFILMTLGGFVMFFAERQPLSRILPKIVMASVGFGFMNVFQKMAFNHANFVSAYVFFTVGTFVGSLAMLIPPSWRKQIFAHSEEAAPRSKFWYVMNRFMAGVGSFLAIYAVSRTSPAIVQAVSGVRYVIIFLGAYAITKLKPAWFREDFRGWVLLAKVTATALVVAGLVLAGLHSSQNTSAAG